MADAKRGIDMAGGYLRQTTVEGRSFWLADDSAARKGGSSAHLLPNYDEFFIAYRDRRPLAQRLKKSAVEKRTDILFTSIAIVNGQLVGTWRRAPGAKGATVELNPLTPITAAETKKLRAAASRYGDYLGMTGELIEGRYLYQSS